ncbi:putative NRPS-like enzyme [Nemania sp. FL0916]|nr:putative NRPS-like enzyme [Nemania sp. FL0916]
MVITADHESVARWRDDLIPHVVDRLARKRPDAEYAEWVTGSGVVAVTYAQLANIVNGLAWWIVEQLGGSGTYGADAEVLAYIGPNDVRYSALVLASIKAGYVLFVTSPRNSPAAHRGLFSHLGCRTLLASDPIPPAGRLILDAVEPARHLSVPSVEKLLAKQYPPYVLDKTFQDIRKSPFVVMHTSGTTGLPKPIIWTHDTCAQVLNSKSRQTDDGTVSVEGSLQNGKRVIVTLPPFHGALLAQLVVGAIPYGNVVVAPVAAAIPTAQAVVDALKQAPADVAILVPSVVAELAQNPDLLDYCATHLETIMYIGGDLPQSVGDLVAAKVYLRCLWGATETGIVPQLLQPQLLPSEPSGRSLWRYVQFHSCVGAVFDEVTDGVYELVVRRDNALNDTQPCFTVPGLDGLGAYRTKDLFEPHPDIPDIWAWRARADDIIVFLNGEKTNPISMEHHIMASNAEVSGALVIGAQRFQAALLIEPASERPLTTAEQAALLERVWPSVEDANRSAPAHARIEKSFILVLSSDRRLIRSGKGTFMRGPSISQYAEEIERLYTNSGVTLEDDDAIPGMALQAMSLEDATRLIRHHVCEVTKWASLDDSDSFFDRGMDSLQGLQLMRALRNAFRRHDFALSTIYQNPTVSELASAFITQNGDDHDERKVMGALLDTYRGLIQQIAVPKSPSVPRSRATGPINVILTGSTGTTTRHVLRALLDHDGVGQIFCVNRGEDGGRAIQYKGFADVGLTTTKLDTRVTFIKADLQQPSLGLDDATYESLRAQVGLIIHAAWPVNFNLALAAFRPQLVGVVNLIALAAAASSKFVFVSSVAAVGGQTSAPPPPEEVLDSFDVPSPFGYGRAKFIAELLADTAARHFKGLVPVTILRIGQVAGPVRRPGLWNPSEWFPSMVLSSLHLGQVPESLGLFDSIDFVPSDILADVILDLVTTTTENAPDAATVFNIRNPHLVPWNELLSAITDTIVSADRPPLQVVPPATWLATLRASASAGGSDDIANKNPAAKLIEFFDGLWAPGLGLDASQTTSHRMVIKRALAASPSLRELRSVQLGWMEKWVKEWIAAQS